MAIEDQWRGVAPPRADSANAWSLLEYRAQDRMAQLLNEADQRRLARLAREPRRSGRQEPRSGVRPANILAAVSALVSFARRMVNLRRGSDASRAAGHHSWGRYEPEG
jgi:hypothetical protein